MNRTTVTSIAVIAAVAAMVVWVLISHAPARGGTQLGSGAPFTLTGKTLDGRSFDLTAYRGKPVVINFFASWCPSCRREAPDLSAFARAHPEVAFVGVDIQDTRDKARAWVIRYGVPYPVVFDPKGTIASAYGVVGIPATFFLDKKGVGREVIVGPATRSGFEEKLKSAL